MTTTIFDLPKDLVNEILSRIPLKSMRALRLTCRKWYNLSKSQSFTEIHQRKLAAGAKKGESQYIVSKGNRLYLTSIVVNENPSTKHLGKLRGLNEQVGIFDLFHCEGLLLFILDDNKAESKILVQNPYLGQTRWIEPKYPHKGEHGWFTHYRHMYALGHVNKKENNTCLSRYKILRFCYYPFHGVGHLLYEIYDFESDLWTSLDVPKHWYIPNNQCGVSLKGNTYWCATQYKGNNYWCAPQYEEKEDDRIICFDFTRERFGPLLRLPFKQVDNSVTLSCVREEKLAALVEHWEGNPNKIDIWITTKIEVEEVLWSKFLTFDTKPECPISSWNFFIDEEKKVVIGLDEDKDTLNRCQTLIIAGEAGYLRKLDLRKRANMSHCRTHLCSYVPTLVKL